MVNPYLLELFLQEVGVSSPGNVKVCVFTF